MTPVGRWLRHVGKKLGAIIKSTTTMDALLPDSEKSVDQHWNAYLWNVVRHSPSHSWTAPTSWHPPPQSSWHPSSLLLPWFWQSSKRDIWLLALSNKAVCHHSHNIEVFPIFCFWGHGLDNWTTRYLFWKVWLIFMCDNFVCSQDDHRQYHN